MSEIAQELADRIDAYWEQHRDRREDSGATPLSEEQLRRLRALGYIR